MYAQHHRFGIWGSHQHPYNHSPYEFGYNHDGMPGVVNMGSALDWILAVLYPNQLASVATVGDLPAAGNNINDYRVVNDDGDGKAASYRWEQREGDPNAKWYKIYDMDWGEDSVLSNFLNATQDVYVYKHGLDDLDSNGDPIVGDLAGQRIYGGASANTNLVLYANAGDGTGPNTGSVFVGDKLSPLLDNTFELGTIAKRWKDVQSALATIANISISSGSLVSGSSALDFGDNVLSTTGSYSAGSITIAAGSITDSSGSIDFDNEDLGTTGNIAANTANLTSLITTNITQTGEAGVVKAVLGVYSASLIVNADVDAAAAIEVSKLEALAADRAVQTSGTGVMETSAVTALELSYLSGVTSAIQAQLDGKASTILDNLGVTQINASLIPDTGEVYDFGTALKDWRNLYLSGAIYDATGSTNITTEKLVMFRNAVGTVDGQTIFWNNTTSTWEVSAPDAEIDHNTISNLTVGDVHTQYAYLAGRTGGQSLFGGVASGDFLSLQGSSHATSGGVRFADLLLPDADLSGRHIGSSALRWVDLHMSGEFKGGRVENVLSTALPASSGFNIGRMYWTADTEDLLVDTGLSLQRLSQENIVIDMIWDGNQVSSTHNTSALIEDATKAVWAVYDAQDGYKQIYAELTKSSTQVTVDVQIALPAGTYRLIGIR